jgi:DNA-binding response OmpR family regulator/signal transduction histidine kinase
MKNVTSTPLRTPRLTIVAVVTIYLILCILLIIPTWREASISTMRDRRTVYNEITHDIDAVASALLEMRAAARGYLITQDAIFRQDYLQAYERLQIATIALQRNISLQSDGKLEVARAELEALIREWRQQHPEYQMSLVEAGQIEAAQREFAQNVNRMRYEYVRRKITDIRTAAHLHEMQIRDEATVFSNQVVLINSILMFLALLAMALITVGYYRQTRMNRALVAAETAAQQLTDTLAIRLTQMQMLNQRLEAGQRVVDALPKLQQSHEPLQLLADTVRHEYSLPAVFLWLNDDSRLETPPRCFAAIDPVIGVFDQPPYHDCRLGPVQNVVWGATVLHYSPIELFDNAFGVVAIATHADDGLVRQLIALLVENVTLFQQLKREDERLSTVIESAPLGFVLTSKTGEVLLANTRAQQLLPTVSRGMTITTLLESQAFYALGGKLLNTSEFPVMKAMQNALVSRSEIIHELGTVRIPVRHEVVPIIPTGYLLVLEDMRKYHELDRLKTDFVSMISHELRTPLAAIIGATSLLHSSSLPHRDGILPTIELIRAQGVRLQTLIDDVLNLSHIERNGITLQRETIDASVLIQKVISRDATWKARCRVTLIQNEVMYVDVGRIEQVLSNLIDNAVKYAPMSTIEIVIGPVLFDSDCLSISVRDYGTPLSDDEYARVFDRFYQAHQHAAHGGVGLGLAICKYFVEAHGGSIRMDATPQRDGSIITFTVPTARHDLQAAKSGQTTAFHALVIDDDDVLPRFIRHALAEVHGSTDVVATVREALERVERVHYDVILVDLRLPDMSGLEFVRDVRNWNATPVIMMTASRHEHDLLDALRAGVDDYVVKPFSTVEIGLRVQNVLRRKRVEDLPVAQVQVGNVVAFLQSKCIEVGGVPVDVTPIEFRMFVLFANHLGQVLSHERILAEVWGDRYDQATQYVWVHISHVRKKLLASGATGVAIETVRSVGYRMQAVAPSAQ